MKNYLLPNPQQRREIPAQFSWVDHRLVRDKYIKHCSCEALSLYLFLLTVADRDGGSYYSDARIMQYIPLDRYWIVMARDELIQYKLIAYQEPVYQILPLDPPIIRAHNTHSNPPQIHKRLNRPEHIKNLIAQLSKGETDD